MQHVFIVGARHILRSYGGYETLVDELTKQHQNNSKIKYHVACKNVQIADFEHNNAHCFRVRVPNIGPAQAVYYDAIAAVHCCNYIKKHQIKHPILYILTCRIGLISRWLIKKVHRLGGKVYLNPDGHEWARGKWIAPVRRYWKYSEKCLVKYADLVVCDSRNIEKYIHEEYKNFSPKTCFIAYGSDLTPSVVQDSDDEYKKWMEARGLKTKQYYLCMGRFVPENNFEIIIREFMRSKSKRDLAVMTTENPKLLAKLEGKLQFSRDSRIKFVGSVYEQELNKKIRENAYGHIHGHEVGGTNPSLLEALSYTDLNLLIDIGFSREVAEDAALYWKKEIGNLARLIDRADQMLSEELAEYGRKAKKRIADQYSWEHIAAEYEAIFIEDGPSIVEGCLRAKNDSENDFINKKGAL